MKKGDRVLVTAHWSSFYRMQGVVKQTKPHVMVLLDGDQHPMRLDDCSLRTLEEEHQPWVLGE